MSQKQEVNKFSEESQQMLVDMNHTVMFYKAKQMRKKARQEKHGSRPTIFSRWCNWRSTMLAKEKSFFSIASLLKDTTLQLRKLSGCRTPNIGFFAWLLVGLTRLFDSDQNLPLHWNNSLKCQTLTWRKRSNLWDRYVQKINVNDKIDNSKEEKTSIVVSIGKLDGVIAEPRWNPSTASSSSTSLTTANELEFMVLHIIWEKVVISVSWKEFQKIDGDVVRTPTHKTHLCSTVWSQRGNAHSMRLAQDQAWFANSFVHRIKLSHLVCHMSRPWLFSHALSSMNTSSSSSTYPTTQREHSVHHAHLQDHVVDKLRHQESLWREDLQRRGNSHNNSHRFSVHSHQDWTGRESLVFSETSAVILSFCIHTGRAEQGVAKPGEQSVVAPRQTVRWRNLCCFFHFLPAQASRCRITSRLHVVPRWIYLMGLGETPDREWILPEWRVPPPDAVQLVWRCWSRDRVPDVASRKQNQGIGWVKPTRNRPSQPTNELNPTSGDGVKTTSAVVVMIVRPTHQLEVGCGYRHVSV